MREVRLNKLAVGLAGLLTLLVTAMGLFVGGGVARAEEPVYGGRLVVAAQGDPLTLDTRINMATTGGIAAFQIQEGLLTTDPKTGEAAPGLAERWEVSEDGRTYTFHLRRGVKFHDGTDFTAEDVKFTFDFLTGERAGGIYVTQFGPFIESVETPDPYVVVITLTSPWADFETMLHRNWATLILSKEAVEAAGDQYGVDVAVGTGPFMLQSWTQGDAVRLVRNPNYWDAGLPYLDEIQIRTVREGTVRVLNAKTGDADIVYDPPADQLPSVQRDRHVQIYSVPGNPFVTIQLNTSSDPFSDKRLRQALYYALNRQAIIDAMYGEYAVLARDLFPSWHWMHDPEFEGVSYDPDKAKALLAEAGYGPNNPLRFELMTGTDPESGFLAVILQGELKKVGMDMTIRPTDSSLRLDIMEGKNGRDSDEYKASLHMQTLPGSTTDDYMFKFYGSAGTLNRMYYNRPGGYTNAEAEALILEGRGAANREAAWAPYRAAVDVILDDVPLVGIAFKQNVNLVNTRVRNYHLLGTNSFTLKEVWKSAP